ncbi:MAG: PAS domain S-box protein [Thermodesulfobacteriota bacterium]
MSSRALMWIGSPTEETSQLMEALKADLEDISVTTAHDGREGLVLLSRNPGAHLIVVIDLNQANLDLAPMVTGIKQINPAIEVIVIGDSHTPRAGRALPRYYGPTFLGYPVQAQVLASCVAKLREMVEAKEDYAQLSRAISSNAAASRRGTEALLKLLSRQAGVGMITIRRDGFFSSYNREAERLTGYGLEEVAHLHVWAQTLLTDYESVRSLLTTIEHCQAERTGKDGLTLRILSKLGKARELSMTILVLPSDVGHSGQVVALFFDPLEISGAREYQTLVDSGACALYTYCPRRGFLRVSSAALAILNRAFGTRLSPEELIRRDIRSLPIPGDMAEVWHYGMEVIAASPEIPNWPIPPLGLPGRRIMGHSLAEKVTSGKDGECYVLGIVVPREDLSSSAFEGVSYEQLACATLNAIPRPFGLFRAVRDSEGQIRDFQCAGINPAGVGVLRMEEHASAEMAMAEVFQDGSAREKIVQRSIEAAETGTEHEFETWQEVGSDPPEGILVRYWIGKVGDGVAVFFHDVTEDRAEEERLKQYRHVFAHMREAMIVTDLEGNVVDWNPASEQMFGYPKEEILGKSTFILARPGRGDVLEEQTRSHLRDGDIWMGEYEFVRPDGAGGVAHTVFALLKDDDGVAYGTVGLCHDLTERKRIEAILKARGEELQEKNLALNTLLRHAEAERERACEQIATDLTRKVAEHVRLIVEAKANPHLVESRAVMLLEGLAGSPATERLPKDDPRLQLSEKELEVAQLIRLGKSTQEIAFILNKSVDTVRLQRISIRKKLGLDRRDRNLAGYLRQLELQP